MKIMKQLIHSHLRFLASPAIDLLQFTYQSYIGVDDAVIQLLHRALPHLEKTGSTVRVIFPDSSVFNTIQSSLLCNKMVRTHCVKDIRIAFSSGWYVVQVLNGDCSGSFSMHFLHISIIISDFRYNSDCCHLQKFSDDSSIIKHITSGEEEG